MELLERGFEQREKFNEKRLHQTKRSLKKKKQRRLGCHEEWFLVRTSYDKLIRQEKQRQNCPREYLYRGSSLFKQKKIFGSLKCPEFKMAAEVTFGSRRPKKTFPKMQSSIGQSVQSLVQKRKTLTICKFFFFKHSEFERI